LETSIIRELPGGIPTDAIIAITNKRSGESFENDGSLRELTLKWAQEISSTATTEDIQYCWNVNLFSASAKKSIQKLEVCAERYTGYNDKFYNKEDGSDDGGYDY
tara:strand:+ start:1424 stop:1738 length:315 start_codon:yes stop_codon:yes gene_type:complete